MKLGNKEFLKGIKDKIKIFESAKSKSEISEKELFSIKYDIIKDLEKIIDEYISNLEI